MANDYTGIILALLVILLAVDIYIFVLGKVGYGFIGLIVIMIVAIVLKWASDVKEAK